MPDLAIVSLLLVPNLVLAVTSKAGNYAGYYMLAGWLVLGIVGGIWPPGYFVYAGIVLVLAAVLFRGRLRIGPFFAQRTRPWHR